MSDQNLSPIPYLQILHSLLRADGSEDEATRATKCMQWLGEHNKDVVRVCANEGETPVLGAVQQYWHRIKSMPTRESLETAVRSQEKAATLIEVLALYDRMEDQLKPVTHHDLNLYLSQRVKDFRTFRMNTWLTNAASIANGSVPQKKDKFGKPQRDLSGVDDAKAYLRARMMTDISDSKPILQGDWTEHADYIEESLMRTLDSPERNRIYTGFRYVDEAIAMGPTEDIRYIGLLGFTNHGKTGYLLNMLYAFAKAGKRVLYVPREDSIEATWQKLTFMHSHFFRLKVPSMSFWKKRSHEVTDEHVQNVKMVLDDLRSGESVKGSIDVLHASTWEQIMSHLESAEQPVDVLAVDYLGHLETPGARDHHEAIKEVFRSAQALTRDYQDGRGIMVITPLQANKSGANKVGEQEAEDQGVYHDLGAVEWYTQAAQDMDLVIGLWNRGDYKANNRVKVSCVKCRTEFFEPHTMDIDPRTRFMRDSSAQGQRQVTGRSTRQQPEEEAFPYGPGEVLCPALKLT